MPRTSRSTPVELAPAPWPDRPSPDAIGEVARLFVLNLRVGIGAKSIRSAALDSGINHATLLQILAGRVWPDLATIAKLEQGLGLTLWPGVGHTHKGL